MLDTSMEPSYYNSGHVSLSTGCLQHANLMWHTTGVQVALLHSLKDLCLRDMLLLAS